MLQSTPVWTSTTSGKTKSIAWGDMDGDGDLDLAVGNIDGPNRVYLNQGSMLQSSPAFTYIESDNTNSVAWGDVDGDGDLDLAVANGNPHYFPNYAPTRLYLNVSGMLEPTATWTSG